MGNGRHEIALADKHLDRMHEDAASALAADQWRRPETVLATGFHDDNAQGVAVWDGTKSALRLATSMMSSNSPGFLGNAFAVGGLYAGEKLLDRALGFDNQPIRGGSMLFDFVAPAALMFSPLNMRYKIGATLVSHLVGKAIDKYAD